MSATIKTIVCPTDFSETARRAFQYACELTDRFGAELHLLHVLHDLATEVPLYGEGLVFPAYLEELGRRQEDLEVEALKKLSDSFDKKWEKGHHITLAVRHGNPFLEIVRYAQTHSADLIVMGTHGRSGLSHALLGSVAEKVVRKAPCAVLTVRPDEHAFDMP